MTKNKTVLIVDDNTINRTILSRILAEDYSVMQASDGAEALKMLDEHIVSAIILDLVMPGMNGYDFLREFSHRQESGTIPVIVSTGNSDKESEVEALRLGAWDFVTKPYMPEIIKIRLSNAIIRSQLSAFQELKYQSEFDVLTDIYNKKKFFEATHEMLTANPETRFAFLRFDIDRFHLINSYFGMIMGDKFLQYIGEKLKEYSKSFAVATYGRIEADIFGFCIPAPDRKVIDEAIRYGSKFLKDYSISFDIVPAFGVYEIKDNTMAVDEIFDRANLAAKSCKGNYFSNFEFYNEEMGEKIEAEQEIVNEMNAAIDEEQFHIWYQPKYDIRTNTPAGAEALVRWIHPEKGMIPPGKFVPLFEHNGFISRLDSYVWEHVCMDIRNWIDEGKSPHPISVNISRVDLSDPHLVQHILDLTAKYNIPHELLNLELTESAYTDNPEKMMKLMKDFQDNGFIILMDDFGSGYSSLSVLKDIDVNVLKIDMRFFSKAAVEGRGKSIIASVIRMAKWLRIPVIAEGVETKEQVEFLKSLGCEYVQGYYFAKPMPEKDYEKYIDSRQTFEASGMMPDFDYERIWNNDFIVTDIMQAAAIFEYDMGKIEIIRVNNSFYDLFGYTNPDENFADPTRYVSPENRAEFLDTFRLAAESGSSAELDYHRAMSDGSVVWMHLKLKYISKADNKVLLYGIFSDITSQKRIDDELMQYRSAISANTQSFGKLLIIDDVEMNREALKLMFIEDYDVVEAENGKDGLEKLRALNGQVDAILLDLIMPVMDGGQFLDELKSDNEFNSIPVIIITSDDSADQQKKTIAMGAKDYITKPFIDDVVKRRVKNVIDYQHRKSETIQKLATGE